MTNRPTIWICGACGREGESREALWKADSSCGYWAVEVYVDSVGRDPTGRVCRASAVGEDRDGLRGEASR
jgi:hypothetical protein